jgi:hypothetical protein
MDEFYGGIAVRERLIKVFMGYGMTEEAANTRAYRELMEGKHNEEWKAEKLKYFRERRRAR